MSKKLKKEQSDYRYDEAVTPYQKAAQEWDKRIGSSRAQANNWRLIALASVLACVLLLVGMIMLIQQKKNVVYVAEVGSSGQVINVVKTNQPYRPTDAQYQYFIAKFVRRAMSLPLDPVILKNNLLEAYQLTASKGRLQFNSLMQKLQPTRHIGQLTQTVDVQSVEQITPNSYSASWRQTSYDQNGKVTEVKRYHGIFTVSQTEPTTEHEILINPLGIHIQYFTLAEKN
ncbi:conjugal transfer protein TrbF [Piscirickettsia litoralis]|uniref:Bacterial virulence protein VirB8 domain-containing protein n=1 Tax=Piscirickettsia litoralis TaxID=1891921 RepID=A0ABX3A3S9_9GAMM|nr:conjugal transfer protein TrbF [Piscirickettsia litoralis]ODN43113.1 hypothetical protein BGC07_09545 [Piscirickettsia litoralis]